MKFFIWYFLVPNFFILCFAANIKREQEFLSFLTINEKIEYEHPNEKFMLNLEEIPENEVLLITKKKNLERENNTIFLKNIPLKAGNESFSLNETNKNGFYLDHRFFIQEVGVNNKSFVNESARNKHKPNEYEVFYLNDSKSIEKQTMNENFENNLSLNFTKIGKISENTTNLKRLSLNKLQNRSAFDITNAVLNNKSTKINDKTEIMILLISTNNVDEQVNKTNENFDEIETSSKNILEGKSAYNENIQNLNTEFNLYKNNESFAIANKTISKKNNFTNDSELENINEKFNEENENFKYFDEGDEHLFDLAYEVKNISEKEIGKKINNLQEKNNSNIESNTSQSKTEKNLILVDENKLNFLNNNNSSIKFSINPKTLNKTIMKISESNIEKNSSIIMKKDLNLSLKNETPTNLYVLNKKKNASDSQISLNAFASQSPIINTNESLINENFNVNKTSDFENSFNYDDEFSHSDMAINTEYNETSGGSKFLGDLNPINETKETPENTIFPIEGKESMGVSSLKEDETTNYFNTSAKNDSILSLEFDSKLNQSDQKKLPEIKSKQINISNQNISFKLLDSKTSLELESDEISSNDTNSHGLYDKSFDNNTNNKKIFSDINYSSLSSKNTINIDNNGSQNLKTDLNLESLPAKTQENMIISSTKNLKSSSPIIYNESPNIIKSINSLKTDDYAMETRNIAPKSQNIEFYNQENSDKFIEVKKMTIPTSLAEKQEVAVFEDPVIVKSSPLPEKYYTYPEYLSPPNRKKNQETKLTNTNRFKNNEPAIKKANPTNLNLQNLHKASTSNTNTGKNSGFLRFNNINKEDPKLNRKFDEENALNDMYNSYINSEYTNDDLALEEELLK